MKFSDLRTRLGAPDVRAVLLWCLPALLVGFCLRAALEIRMPSAFYHPDSEQIFDTWRNLQRGEWHIHEKKTPLGPLFYTLPLLLHLPVLPIAAVVQHLLGLGMVAMVGALVVKSFARWRFFIIPVTVLVAINPILLWYEHVALPETFYVFSIVATAVAALAYARGPSWPRLAALGAALFATAGFRPEGKLFLLFGLALVVAATWRQPRRLAWSLGAMALLTALCFVLNSTRQGGSLLYSNVAHLTPDRLWSAPGFAETHRDYFRHLESRWSEGARGGIPHERKKLFGLLRTYLEQKGEGKVGSVVINQLCGRLGAEVCLRQWYRLPQISLMKFRFALRNPTADDFGPDWLFRKQAEALSGGGGEEEAESLDPSALGFAQIAYGRSFASREEVLGHLRQVYVPFTPDWLTAWQERYQATIMAWRLPDRPARGDSTLGLPYLYLAAVLGLLALTVRDARLRAYHFLWLGMLLFMAFVLTLTGSNLGRFRLGFEPFWVLYAAGFIDAIVGLCMAALGSKPRAQPLVPLTGVRPGN